MQERPLAAVVLAAGQGKRMKADVPKVLVEACGRALLEHVLAALQPVASGPVVVVHGHGGDAVKAALAKSGVVLAHQAEQRGTGHAVQCALPALRGFGGDVLVVCGDTPLLTSAVLRDLVRDHARAQRALTVLSAEVREPGSLGRILRGPDGRLKDIRETADATPAERAVREINTGVMVAGIDRLAPALARLTPENAQGEYYLTDVPRLLLADGLPVDAFRTLDEGAALGVNNPLELAEAVRILRRRAVDRLLLEGVRIADPDSTRIDVDVEIGPGTTLLPFTFVGAGARIGRKCRIGPHAHVPRGAVVPDGATLP
ncbi:MAG: NTP transferase domain-containing protein [Planctomycetes bacterium]|nr:NTP transferase domain-containing protein [Planctomycetota bacterium]